MADVWRGRLRTALAVLAAFGAACLLGLAAAAMLAGRLTGP